MYKRKRKRRFKINDDTMTSIVVYSLLFCVGIVVTGFIYAAKGIDVSALADVSLKVFGTELGICGLMKISERFHSMQDRRIEAEKQAREERRKRREERRNMNEGSN